MCNLTALPPHRPASQRHKCGTSAAPKRSRTGKSAPPQRTKVSIIRYLCAPNCGTFLGAGTTSPRLCLFFAMRTAQNWLIHLKNPVILTTWLMHSFPIPNLHHGLPFSLPGLARRPFPLPQSATREPEVILVRSRTFLGLRNCRRREALCFPALRPSWISWPTSNS